MSTVKADSLQPTIAGNNLILKTGSGDVERVRIAPTGAMTVSSTVASTFGGSLTVNGVSTLKGKLGLGAAYSGTPVPDLDIATSNNATLLDPQFNTFNTTKSRAAAAFGHVNTNTKLFIGNSSSDAVWLQVQNANNLQYNLALNPVGGNVGVGTTGPTETLDVNGTLRVRDFTGGTNVMVKPNMTTTGVGRVVPIMMWASIYGSGYIHSNSSPPLPAGTWFVYMSGRTDSNTESENDSFVMSNVFTVPSGQHLIIAFGSRWTAWSSTGIPSMSENHSGVWYKYFTSLPGTLPVVNGDVVNTGSGTFANPVSTTGWTQFTKAAGTGMLMNENHSTIASSTSGINTSGFAYMNGWKIPVFATGYAIRIA